MRICATEFSLYLGIPDFVNLPAVRCDPKWLTSSPMPTIARRLTESGWLCVFVIICVSNAAIILTLALFIHEPNDKPTVFFYL